MTPKEKAKELVDKFKNDLFEQRNVTIYTEDAMLIALIAVDEILKRNEPIQGHFWDYWEQVKQEIKQL